MHSRPPGHLHICCGKGESSAAGVRCLDTHHCICFCMAFASRLPVQAPAAHKHRNARARSLAPCLRQHCSNTSLHHCASRRHSLLSGSAILGSAILQNQLTVAQAATAVYHEVNVSLPSIDEADSPERPEDPPTYVTATGRIVASTYVSWQSALDICVCPCGRCCCLVFSHP